MKNYSITRKEAWQIAWISLRTLDRYVLSKKIEYKKIKWRVLFCKDDLEKIRLEKNVDIIDEVDTNFDFKKEKTEYKVSEKKEIVAENFWEKISEMMPIMHVKIERDTYKKMFEIANSDLKEKQNQLERANFKLWELLAKQELPLLENKQKSQEINILEKKLKKSEEITNSLKNEVSFQKFIKTIFVIILLLTVSILSFWYVYNFKV